MRFSGGRFVVIVAVVISLACALGAWLFLYFSQRVALTELEGRALDLAAMIANRAMDTDGDFSFLGEPGNRPGPFGELLYLEVKVGGKVVLKSAERFEARIPLPDPAPTEPRGLRVNTSRGWAVAAFCPFEDPERGSGYVWVVLAEPFRKRFGFLAGVVSAVALAVNLSALTALFLWEAAKKASLPPEKEEEKIRVGELVIDRLSKRVRLFGAEVRLTPKEFALLELLASSPGRVFSPEEIVAAVWPESSSADDKNVKQCVYSLRKKLSEAVPGAERVIVTEPGFGYKFAPSETEPAPI